VDQLLPLALDNLYELTRDEFLGNVPVNPPPMQLASEKKSGRRFRLARRESPVEATVRKRAGAPSSDGGGKSDRLTYVKPIALPLPAACRKVGVFS
jgi:hypothetical protein